MYYIPLFRRVFCKKVPSHRHTNKQTDIANYTYLCKIYTCIQLYMHKGRTLAHSEQMDCNKNVNDTLSSTAWWFSVSAQFHWTRSPLFSTLLWWRNGNGGSASTAQLSAPASRTFVLNFIKSKHQKIGSIFKWVDNYWSYRETNQCSCERRRWKADRKMDSGACSP